jgi:hypothetical protein
VCQAGTDAATVHQHAQINLFLSRLTEPQRRWYAGVLSQTSAALSDRQLALITGLDPKTIARGRAELAAGLPVMVPPRQRHPGGGRQPSEKKDPALSAVLLDLVQPHTAGDPMSSTKWLNCRLRDVQAALAARGHPVSLPVISRLLRAAGYRLRGNRKQVGGPADPQRDAQFRHIAAEQARHLAAGQPVISVDTKKKELIGNFKNPGRTWGQTPEVVNMHDFESDAVGRAVPYGIYDLTRNVGTVYVGQSADTPQFAVEAIAAWCASELRRAYPQARALLIEADGGGSNSARSRVWKAALQEQVADRFGLTVTVCHYPPGASKWNPIEHRLFSEISKTWAGCPLRTFEIMLGYLRPTTTSTGLQVRAELVATTYAKGVKVAEAVMKRLQVQVHNVCPQWNYTIYPRPVADQRVLAA